MSANESDIGMIVSEDQHEFIFLCRNLPDSPTNRAQSTLMLQYGTPLDYAVTCAEMIGEISINEATEEVLRYARHWQSME